MREHRRDWDCRERRGESGRRQRDGESWRVERERRPQGRGGYGRPSRREMRRMARRERRRRLRRALAGGMAFLLVAALAFAAVWFPGRWLLQAVLGLGREPATLLVAAPAYDVQLLTPNEYSRPQLATEEIRGIVLHYTANPGTSAQNNRDYFEGLKDSHLTHASSHFIVGLEGEIIQCIPTAEQAYASNTRNVDTVSIETCYTNEDGSYSRATYDSMVHLTAWLMGKFNLKTENVIRHYDVTGKACPLYFVEHEDAWEQFLRDVEDYLAANGEKPE